MNYTRLALAAVAATIADFVYGFAVYGNLLTGSFLAQPGSTQRRSADGQHALGATVSGDHRRGACCRQQFRGLGGGLWFSLCWRSSRRIRVVVNFATNVTGSRLAEAGRYHREWLVSRRHWPDLSTAELSSWPG